MMSGKRSAPPPDLYEAVELLARFVAPIIARAVVLELQAGTMPDHVDQHTSPLGSRRHIGAIRSGTLAGAQVGRRWLAKREDVETFIASIPKQKTTKAAGKSPEELLAAELGIAIGPIRRLPRGRRGRFARVLSDDAGDANEPASSTKEADIKPAQKARKKK
jgi:hypothetical protein